VERVRGRLRWATDLPMWFKCVEQQPVEAATAPMRIDGSPSREDVMAAA